MFLITIGVGLAASAMFQAAPYAVGDKVEFAYPRLTAPTYSVGQDVEIRYYGEWVRAQVTEVADIDGKQQVRTSYPGQTTPTPYLVMNNVEDIRLPTGRLGKDLTVGRYRCSDGGSRPDLDFRVAQYGQYSDPYGENAGTFTTSGDTITFKGGKLDRLTGQQLKDNRFYFNPQTSCSYEMES
ncbi:hypothetical protein [Sphingomonas sp.]|uniref:hypothetical protein n=1 Tax=Sphingomonas sp. TaxID=28214 RepID=UPI001EBACEC6|nr:hypothetical protein [Sphingomonas sp.]MBX3594915.1 hypothetical protein [Sphingomonas sp.]